MVRKKVRTVARVKTAVSIEESLFREAEAWAGRLGISRSRLFAEALREFVRRRENEELLRSPNEAHADGLDEEEREFLERAEIHHGRLLEETGNERKPGG